MAKHTGIKTAVIYCRVSTKKQSDNGDSLELQEKACKNLCKRRGITYLETFKDAFSGKSSNRPAFQQAISYAKMHKVDYFVIFDIDRFSREGFAVYKGLKNDLAKHNIDIIDSKNVIGESRLAVENDNYDLSEYDWATENPSEMAEMIISANAESERKKILQRTIVQAIELSQKGYWIRGPIMGFQNGKIKIDGKKRTILVPHTVQSQWVIAMYELRAGGMHSDESIVQIINDQGYCSGKHNLKLTVKQMQYFIKKPVYAGIISEQWTNHKPIKAQFDGLVSIDLWNRANSGKIKIIQKSDGTYQLLDAKSTDFALSIGRRKKYDPELPYRNLVKSSTLNDQYITGSRSRNRRGNLFAYYHPVRKRGQIAENIPKQEFEETIHSFLDDIVFHPVWKIVFVERLEEIFRAKQSVIIAERKEIQTQLDMVNLSIKRLQAKILDIDASNTTIFKTIEDQLKDLYEEKETLEGQISDHISSGVQNIEGFKQFCFYLIEHLKDVLFKSQNLEEKKAIFTLIFREIPTYQNIVNRTPNIYPILACRSQQKNSREGILEENLDWQSSGESNSDQRLWRPLY